MMPFSMSKALFVPLSKGCLGVYQLCPSNRAIFVKEESVRRLFFEMIISSQSPYLTAKALIA